MSSTASVVISVSPATLPTPDRGADLQVRVTAPIAGGDLPVIVFSHGYGKSYRDYGPLVDFWTSHGFAVLQPTHLDSGTYAIPPEDPRTPNIWRLRITDLAQILDNLDTLIDAVPGLLGRVNADKVAVAGHSWGATTASALLGARVIGPDGVPGEDLTDHRVKAGVLLALAGRGQGNLTPFAAEHFAFMSPEFSLMRAPTLLVAGDADQSKLTTRGPDWWTDGFHDSPGAKHLLTLFGAEHSLGGVPGYKVTETTDENPERVRLINRVATAYLNNVFDLPGNDWATEAATLNGGDPLGRLEAK